jgi:F0F1-type ATP synthase membrane subunit b/b'
MINIFSDIHTYLVASFLIVVLLLYKYGKGRAVSMLQAKIDSISDSVTESEKRRRNAETRLAELNKEILEAEDTLTRIVNEAHETAKKIVDASNEQIKNMLEQKEKEYVVTTEKIKSNIVAEMHEKIVNLAIEEVLKIIEAKKDNMEAHSAAIERAFEMLSEEIGEEISEESESKT